MPKVTDHKAYFKEIATKAGLKDDVIQQVLGSDEAFKAFTDGFKPLPDYSHDLDDVRTKTKTDKDKEYEAWFADENKKFQQYVAGLDKLKKYEETYGPLDTDNLPNPGDRTRGGKVLTQEDIDKLVDTKLQTALAETLGRRDNTYLDYLELREQHLATFGKPLDRKSFEAAYKEHPEWGSLQSAYKSFVEPEMEKVREAKFKADADRRYEEGVRDGFSRRAVPTDHQPRVFSPMFDKKEELSKLSDADQEKHSREAFFEGLREGNKQTA